MSSERYETWETSDSSPSSTNGQETHERGYEDEVSDQDERLSGGTPAFLLDVPVLNVDEIDLEVDELRAHISLRAELASFVKINVGVDAYVENLKLNIKGVEAQALLKVNLDRVLGTLDRALEAINRNPQILNETVQDVNPAAGDASGDSSQGTRGSEPDVGDASRPEEGVTTYADGMAQQTGGATDRAIDGIEQARDEAGKEATSTLDGLQIEEEYIDERGQIVGRARDKSGNVVEGILDEEGNVTDPSVPEEAEEQESEDDGEVEATDAARRKAGELGVNLSRVKGTGSGGRVLVKDVERATKQPGANSARN